jgi:hypothetical protein
MTGDDDHRVEVAGQARLVDQRNLGDRRRRGRGGEERGDGGTDPRMDDLLERAARGGVGEDQPAEPGAIQPAIAATPGPKRSTTARQPSVPGATASRARTSASTTGTCSARKVAATVLLPVAIPPVRATRRIG